MTPEKMNIPFSLQGRSGTSYTPANFLTEMSTRHKNAIVGTLKPIMPLVYTFLLTVQQELPRLLAGSVASKVGLSDEIIAAASKLDLTDLFAQLIEHDLDQRLLAQLFFPIDGPRWYHEEQLEARMEDLDEVTYAQKFEAFKAFFTSAMSSSRNPFLGFIRGKMMKPAATSMHTNS